MKKILLVTSLLLMLPISNIYAQDNKKVEQLEDKIEIKEKELEKLKSELSDLTKDNNSIEINKPIKIDDYEITITSFDISNDNDGNDALVINYHFVNNSNETASPYQTFRLVGFQDGVETERPFMVDGVDLGLGQKELKSNSEIDAQTFVGIESLEKPLLLELRSDNYENKSIFEIELDLNNLPN